MFDTTNWKRFLIQIKLIMFMTRIPKYHLSYLSSQYDTLTHV